MKGYSSNLTAHFRQNIIKPIVQPLGTLGVGMDEVMSSIPISFREKTKQVPIKIQLGSFRTADDFYKSNIGRQYEQGETGNTGWQGSGLM